jgi:hypothetical protein
MPTAKPAIIPIVPDEGLLPRFASLPHRAAASLYFDTMRRVLSHFHRLSEIEPRVMYPEHANPGFLALIYFVRTESWGLWFYRNPYVTVSTMQVQMRTHYIEEEPGGTSIHRPIESDEIALLMRYARHWVEPTNAFDLCSKLRRCVDLLIQFGDNALLGVQRGILKPAGDV